MLQLVNVKELTNTWGRETIIFHEYEEESSLNL